jgi:hypothetical protein
LCAGGVESRISNGHEADVQPGELVQHVEKVSKASPEPVNTPDGDHIDLPGPCCRQHTVESRT